MINFFINSSVLFQTIIATFFTFFITSLGASIVFIFKKVNGTLLDAMLGLSAGVMLAASYFSLLNPAIEGANALHMQAWLIVALGFLIGGLFLIISDIIFNKILSKRQIKNNHSIKRSIMLILSITLHNIPEGLAVGCAFGSIAMGLDGANLMGAVMLAIGIAIQNFPEGTAVSLPLRRENFTRTRAFIYGSLSGIVEPIAGIIGCLLVIYVKNILPFFLSFAAGAMIYVAISELIPESQKNIHQNRIPLCLYKITKRRGSEKESNDKYKDKDKKNNNNEE